MTGTHLNNKAYPNLKKKFLSGVLSNNKKERKKKEKKINKKNSSFCECYNFKISQYKTFFADEIFPNGHFKYISIQTSNLDYLTFLLFKFVCVTSSFFFLVSKFMLCQKHICFLARSLPDTSVGVCELPRTTYIVN